jgi:hypothetical protein
MYSGEYYVCDVTLSVYIHIGQGWNICLATVESNLQPLDTQNNITRGVNMGGGFTPPQRNDPVGLKLSAVGLKIMRLFTRGALQSKLNIFETRRPIRLKLLSWKFAQTESSSSEIIW